MKHGCEFVKRISLGSVIAEVSGHGRPQPLSRQFMAQPKLELNN